MPTRYVACVCVGLPAVGRFDVQTTLVNLVAAMGLLAIATKIVDFLMMHGAP